MKFIEDITEFIFISDEPQKSDIIFIPGSSYPEMAEKAAMLWKEKYSPLILPSGKYSIKLGSFSGPMSKTDIYTGQYTTEWEFLRDVLIKNGVGKSSILKEDEATNTYQNAIYSKKVTDRLKIEVKKAIICCQSFHARRCLMYYQLLYPQTEFTVCPVDTQGINSRNWHSTDEGIEKVLGELERCGHQFVDIFKSLRKKIKAIYGD
ncbi:YdcF family protein [Acetivibrio clariflavus]|uniref:DUF218 domain-containing protein n=1 Tax=Acetivibrio clariflavus (strain DSM 19732 / NBRC 101661 / EBR45) TaxID=720554 RepID=G8LT68_ACECE|nr:YdcF family protein [Acetivibrio clariflavus]AEV67272.1 hypothetical protein Clocl_0561 [Acetivibrio clariflavus DSM 19732]